MAQQAGPALGSLLGQIPAGVAGNFTHELAKLGLRSLAERVARGELPANHDLVRACRRSALRATAVMARQFAEVERGKADAGSCEWAERLEAARKEEALQAESDAYLVPPSALDGRIQELVGDIEGEANPGASLQQLALEEVLRELRAWHAREWAPRVPREPLPPEEFERWLRLGWPYVELPERLLGKALRLLFLRRGSAARMVRRSQAELSDQRLNPGRLSWFSVFAACFAEELKTNQRVSAIFVPQLLQRINRRLEEAGGRALTAEQLGTALRTELDSLAQRLGAELRQAIAEEIAKANRPVLEAQRTFQAGLDDVRNRAQDTQETVHRIEASLHFRAGVRIPRQLPPAASDGILFGRTGERERLRAKLARGENASVVGFAGFGKTALAAAALRDVLGESEESLQRSPFPDGVVYLDLYKLRARLEETLGVLAEAFLGADYPNLPPEKRARLACNGKRALFVIEGAELADGLEGRALLPQILDVLSPENRRLVLTRSLSQTDPGERVMLEEALAPPDAEALLRHRTGNRLAEPVLRAVLELLHGHPLALTWAGGLLARGDETPEQLAEAWRCEKQDLSDPARAEHTLRWLFERSVQGLPSDARLALEAAGLLAHDAFPLGAIAAVLESPERARAALRPLVQASVLRLDGEAWRFTHVLGYRFARREQGSSRELRVALGAWLRQHLSTVLSAGGSGQSMSPVTRSLLHLGALLRTDSDQSLWDPLAMDALYDVVTRLHQLGRLEAVSLALKAVEGWFERLEQETARRNYWLRERSTLANRRGDARLTQGDLAAALASYEEAREIRARLAADDPSSVLWQRDLSVSLIKLGDVRRTQGDLAAALASYEEAREIVARLAADDPGNAQWQRDLSVSLNRLGDVRRAQGDLAAALASYEEAREIAARLAADDPGNAEWQRDLSVSHERLGDVRRARGDLAAALASYEEAREIAARLAADDPSNAEWQRDLSVSHERLGDVRRARGDLAAALASYEEARGIRARLAADDPSNAQWQRDLSLSHERLGDVRRARGDLAAALASYEEAREIRARLAADDPSNAEWQRDLSYCLTQLALVHEQKGEALEALELAEASLQVDERLAALDPTNATWRQDVEVSRAQVARLRAASG